MSLSPQLFRVKCVDLSGHRRNPTAPIQYPIFITINFFSGIALFLLLAYMLSDAALAFVIWVEDCYIPQHI